MDARALTVRELLENDGRAVQYRVPVFQRTYEWRAETVERLIEDVVGRIDAGADSRPHFIGAFVFLDEAEATGQPDHQMVIDGQQRLITLSIAIALLERRVGNPGPSVLHNPGLGIAARERIRPARVDRLEFESLVRGVAPNEPHRLSRAADVIAARTTGIDAALVLGALLDGVVVVAIRLDAEEDAATVFESLNSTGQPLTQADLVRTFLLSRFVDVEAQEHVDDTYWRPMEARLRASVPERQSRQRISQKDTVTGWYLREWLMRNGGRVDTPRVYERFVTVTPKTAPAAEEALRALESNSHHYVRLEKPQPTDRLYSNLVSLRRIGYNVHWPLFLQLFERAHEGEFGEEDIGLLLAGCESLFMRRAIVGWPTNLLSRLFEQIAASRPTTASAVWPMFKPHWPSDVAFRDSLLTSPLYDRRYPRSVLMHLLQQLDLAYGNKESKLDDKATVEHVMPQTIGETVNGRAWRQMLGPDWARIHGQWLHTLGNLSITQTNSEMSNRAFLGPNGKREWLGRSLFEMNRRISQLDQWTEAEMSERAEWFASTALRLWPRPPS